MDRFVLSEDNVSDDSMLTDTFKLIAICLMKTSWTLLLLVVVWTKASLKFSFNSNLCDQSPVGNHFCSEVSWTKFLLIAVDLIRGHLDNVKVENSLADQRLDGKYSVNKISSDQFDNASVNRLMRGNNPFNRSLADQRPVAFCFSQLYQKNSE